MTVMRVEVFEENRWHGEVGGLEKEYRAEQTDLAVQQAQGPQVEEGEQGTSSIPSTRVWKVEKAQVILEGQNLCLILPLVKGQASRFPEPVVTAVSLSLSAFPFPFLSPSLP